jgi:hypothetical protein
MAVANAITASKWEKSTGFLRSRPCPQFSARLVIALANMDVARTDEGPA